MPNPEKPEDILKAYEERAISDGEAVDDGGKFGFTGNNPNPRLEFPPAKVRKTHEEMTEAKIQDLSDRQKYLEEKRTELESVLLRDPINFIALKEMLGLESSPFKDLEIITKVRGQLENLRIQIDSIIQQKDVAEVQHDGFFQEVIQKDLNEDLE